MFEHFKFRRLIPYLARRRGVLTVGTVCLIAANYLEIQVATLLGDGLDWVRLNLGALTGKQYELLGWFAALVVATAVAGGVARFWMRQLIIGASRDIEYEFRNDFFAHLLRLSPEFYDRHRTGDLMSRSTSDMDAIRMVIGPCIMYMANTLVMLPLTMGKMMAVSPALMTICWLPLLLLMPLVFYFKKRINVRFRRVQELMSDLSANVQEALSGIRVVKVFAREGAQARRFNAISDDYVTANLRLAKLQSIFMPLLSVVVGLSILALVWGGSVMIIRGTLTIGDLMTFFLLLTRSIWPIAAFGWVMAQLERGAASMERVEEIFRQQPEIPTPALDGPPATAPAAPHPRLEGRIELKNLTFQYAGGAQPTLRDLTLDIPAGTTLGVTGPIGCGKSTLAALLTRRYNPGRGMLWIDGKDILDWPVDALRRQIGVVDQEPFLFSQTIETNIGFGLAEGAEAEGPARTLAAAETAQLTADLPQFPNGFQTILGERGINLSGGQRQRTALARALARDPRLLILDDALAAVDTQTEEAILRGLKQMLGSRTTLLISHRISTVSLADQILYLDDGRLVEQGTHAELLARRGRYWELSQRQQLAEEIEKTA